MTKLALISDIHGNLSGLKTVLEDIENQGCDRILCLGDLVDGGNHNEEVIYLLQSLNIPCIQGNHDQCNDLKLLPENQDFLNSLPPEIIENNLIFTHISPRQNKLNINNPIEAWNVFEEIPYYITFVGHIHIPIIFGQACEEFGSSTIHEFEYEKPFYLEPHNRYIICPGAIGYSRDHIFKLRYAIYDDSANSIEFRAIEGELLPFGQLF